MYEGLANILQLKGMGMAEDAAGFQRAFRLKDMIPIVAAQAMPKQAIMRPAPMPPQMSSPVYRDEGGKLVDGGKVDGDDYVIDAYTVAALGNGSSDAGGKLLDQSLPQVQNTDGSKAGMVQEEIGDGMSDNVSYEVSNGGDITEARISQDEYIVDANQVKELGGGDVDEGTARLDKLREEIRKQAYGTKEQPNEISAVKTLEKFMGT
tara:strand:+ start:3845 stop:4465 length:621 start_codon:yes stop_codon:yes gene_type:complete